MLKRRNRKGFTLAELLIVVAIIAILVAIAVPLFVGSLNKAREARDNANIRAVRGAAVVYLLENSTDETLWGTSGSYVEAWDVTATLNANGEITSLTVAEGDSNPADGKIKEEDDGTFTVTLNLEKTDIGDM